MQKTIYMDPYEGRFSSLKTRFKTRGQPDQHIVGFFVKACKVQSLWRYLFASKVPSVHWDALESAEASDFTLRANGATQASCSTSLLLLCVT